jgi:periplasmic protein TonB
MALSLALHVAAILGVGLMSDRERPVTLDILPEGSIVAADSAADGAAADVVVAAPDDTQSVEALAPPVVARVEPAQTLPEKRQIAKPQPETSAPASWVAASETTIETTTEAAADAEPPQEQPEDQPTDAVEAKEPPQIAPEESPEATTTASAKPSTTEPKNGLQSFTELKQASGNVPPRYDNTMRLQRMEGRGQLSYFVRKDGTVENTQLLKSTGHPELDQAAVTAFKNYRFVPGQAGQTLHDFEFRLTGPEAQSAGRLRVGQIKEQTKDSGK